MLIRRLLLALPLLVLVAGYPAAQGQAGSIRGYVEDADFEAPLPSATVTIVELGLEVRTTDQGNYVFGDVAPGTYTLLFAKPGYVREVVPNVVVTAGALTDVDAALAGEFTELEEFVVEDLQAGAGTETQLLQLRFQAASLLDSIGADLMSRAGASDAASALTLVSGATVQDGKFAVIRGLPDRYVSSQLNGVRLPSADEDTRAVELDQFPSSVIESIQVSKTFTPDQQGDASGGAVDVRLKSIPDAPILLFSVGVGYNRNVWDNSNYLSYFDGGVDFLGNDDGKRRIQFENLGSDWSGAVGVSQADPETQYKWSLAAGGKTELDSGVRLGGFASVFYERDTSHYDDGRSDLYTVQNPGGSLVPEQQQQQANNEFLTALFDITRSSTQVQWGGLGAVGLETDNNSITLAYLYTRTTDDTVTLAENTRGKAFYFPNYDLNNPQGPGNISGDTGLSPYIRTETLQYTERAVDTLQLSGEHTLPFQDWQLGVLAFSQPVLDWTVSASRADLDQPDKRQFGSTFIPRSFQPGVPPFQPPKTNPSQFVQYKPAALSLLGNLQRIFKEIEEESEQYSLNLRMPFEQWADDPGYFKFGLFSDKVTRKFDQDTYSNFGDTGASFFGSFDQFWSAVFPFEGGHDISDGPPFVDVDYNGRQDIRAAYGMIDIPLSSQVKLIAGARVESTDISIANTAEANATWFPPGSNLLTSLQGTDADVEFSQNDLLPSLTLVFDPHEKVSVRAAFAETVARQTFKELTPILQQEFLGGPIFIGNPELQMSNLTNYDLRIDVRPYNGSLISASWFKKDIEDAIEFVQRQAVGFSYTTTLNYPDGELTGFEFEIRQDLGSWWWGSRGLDGLTLGANATFIDSEVTLPAAEAALFLNPAIQSPLFKRDATNAPEHLYNLFLTYDWPGWGTQTSLFYTVRGDTLVAGASAINEFIPNVYEAEYGTLNFSLSQQLGKHWRLRFQAKNLTNPQIQQVYRSEFVPGGDVVRTQFTRGQEYSLTLSLSL